MCHVSLSRDDYKIDTKYKGGIDPPNVVRDVSQRKVPERDVKQDQTVVIRLSKSGIDQLRSGQPLAFARLMNLMREAFHGSTGFKPVSQSAPTTPVPSRPASPEPVPEPIRMPARLAAALTSEDASPEQRAEAVARVVQAIPRVTRSQAKAQQPQLRRSARLAARRND